jgi:hypothetical protein
MEESTYPQELLQASISERVRFFVNYTMPRKRSRGKLVAEIGQNRMSEGVTAIKGRR